MHLKKYFLITNLFINNMKQGIINVNTDRGKVFGFTSDKYVWTSYLWAKDNRITISFIETKEQGKGYLSELFNNIKKAGYQIAVPTPFPRMQNIIEKKGFKKILEKTELGDMVEIWIK